MQILVGRDQMGSRATPRAVLQPRGEVAPLHSRASLRWLGSTFFLPTPKRVPHLASGQES